MRCIICGLEIHSIEEVFEDEWILSFFDGGEKHGPLCPSCAEILLHIGEGGEYSLKKEYRGRIVYNDQMESEDDDPFDDLLLGFILN
jgi:hypothetical protein